MSMEMGFEATGQQRLVDKTTYDPSVSRLDKMSTNHRSFRVRTYAIDPTVWVQFNSSALNIYAAETGALISPETVKLSEAS